MALKKATFNDNEIAIFDEAVIYKRGEYWQFRMWLAKEGKYARLSLKTRSQSTAEDKAKQQFYLLMSEQSQGKKHFSLTTKAGVEMYLAQRWKDVEANLIVKGRYSTIKTHLAHWLEFIKRDTKLKELERTDGENYFHSRTKTKKNLPASQSTVENEQSTINAMMSWLYKRKETDIDGFDFKKLKRIDRGNEDLRRASFTDEEVGDIVKQLKKIVAEAVKHIDKRENLVRAVIGYYFLVLIITGLRRGEQLQLRWMDFEHIEHIIGGDEENSHSLVKITVRAETSKARKTRKFAVRDRGYFGELFNLLYPRYIKANAENPHAPKFGSTLIFSVNGKTPITVRAIDYMFDQVLDLAEVTRRDTRDLVPYSFRHYFITKRVNSGLHSMAVSEMCGTSPAQIEKTYYHTTEAKMISNAMADYCYNKDGLLIPK
jgi:integrase